MTSQRKRCIRNARRNKMGNHWRKYHDPEIISEKSLQSVNAVIEFLRDNVRNPDLFRANGNDVEVQQILNELERGNVLIQNHEEEGRMVECASALQLFLSRLKRPLVPPHIQALALDDSPGVSAEIIAHDVLGLLRQETSGRHTVLIANVLHLLNGILKNAPADELRGNNVPITMLPIFFNMQLRHIPQWRRVAMIFIEMVRYAPAYFEFNIEDENFI